MGLAYGRRILGNLHERVGEEEQFRGDFDPMASDPWVNGAWARVIGWHADVEGSDFGVYTGGPKYDADMFAFEAGLDLYRAEYDNGVRDHVGAYFALGSMTADVTHVTDIPAGTATVNGTSLAAYWTRFWDQGAYLDGVVQGTWYDASGDAGYGFTLSGEAVGVAASLEGGWPVALPGGWFIEPQGQLVYQTIDGKGDDAAAHVRFSDMESLAGRFGARFAKSWVVGGTADDPQELTVWVRPNVWHEFLDAPTTSFSSARGYVDFNGDPIEWWGQINLGVTWQMTRTASIYANVGYDFDFEGKFQGYDGTLGLRLNW